MLTEIESFDFTKINMHDPYEVNDNLFKVDLSQDKLKPIMLVLKDLQVLSFTNNIIILSLKSKENIKKILDDIDTHVVKLIQEKKITKKIKAKFNYRQLTSSFSNKDLTCDILSLNVDLKSENYKTDIYQRMNKKLSIEEATNIMKDNSKVDIVLEIVSVLFNKEEGFIYLENVIRQMKVRKVKPKRIEKLEYSFVDTESESENDNNIQIENDDENEDDDDDENEDKESKSTDDDCLLNTHKVVSDEDENIDINIDSDTSSSD
jgi:hypothetical protein